VTWNGALTKIGAGELIFIGLQAYTGATAVNAGTLTVNGSLGSSAVTVNSGGTLAGGGTLGVSATIASGGHLAPGNSPGTITFTNGLTLTAGSILDFQLGTASDLIRVSGGTLTGPGGGGDIILNLSNSGGFAAGTYPLFNYAGTTGTSGFALSDFTFGSTIAGFDHSLGFNGSTLELTSSISAVPEPSTYAALAGATMLAFAGWRGRSRVSRPVA